MAQRHTFFPMHPKGTEATPEEYRRDLEAQGQIPEDAEDTGKNWYLARLAASRSDVRRGQHTSTPDYSTDGYSPERSSARARALPTQSWWRFLAPLEIDLFAGEEDFPPKGWRAP